MAKSQPLAFARTRSPSFNCGRFLRNAAIAAATITIAVGGPILVWKELLEDHFVAKRFGHATERIHRSGQISESLVASVLRDHGIREIVDLTEPEYMPPGKVREREIAEAEGIEILSVPLVGDGTGDLDRYATAVGALIEAERSGKSILVHCAAGSYRTGGVVACFRMLEQGWSEAEALAEAEEYGWDPDQPRLREFLAAHREEIRARLVARGILPATDQLRRDGGS